MATNVNAAALDESPMPDSVAKPHKQTIDPYNVRFALPLYLILRTRAQEPDSYSVQ